jgi:hypothetical protein
MRVGFFLLQLSAQFNLSYVRPNDPIMITITPARQSQGG